MTAWTPESIEWLQTAAAAQGFALAGVASAEDDVETVTRFEHWIDSGHQGEMQYLARRNEAGELLRRSARSAMPWAKSVIVCALHYNMGGERSVDAAARNAGWIARYAWTGTPEGKPLDYHDDLLRRLRALEAALPACDSRCYVDTGPILERDFAARAGIGWIGKNTCVLNQQLGSWLLLGVIVTSIPMQAAITLAPDRCGSCTRCIDACPTSALLGDRSMDASLCISYLTIEKKSDIASELAEKMGRQVFGCDICQDVCPWNRRAPIATHLDLKRRDELINPSLEWLASLDAAGFKREFAGSPLERTKRKRLHRNVAIAMGNSGDATHIPTLEDWAKTTESPAKEAAAWALRKLRSASIEPDPHA